jgi:LysR family transcriptional regulator, transcriptional activator for bauABCD operon
VAYPQSWKDFMLDIDVIYELRSGGSLPLPRTKLSPSRRKQDVLLFRRVDLNLFKTFREIARAKGIGAAARRLNMQQPAVSLSLQRLEAHVGVSLCVRTSRGIELTPAGRIVAGLCEHLFQEVQSIPNAVASAIGQVEGVLTIRLISSVVSPELDDALTSMRLRHPRVRLRMDVAPCRLVIEALAKGHAEVCITFDGAPQSDLHYEPLVRECQQLYCSKWHPLFGARVSNPSILAEERFVLTGSDEPDDVRNFRMRYRLGRQPAGEAENLEEAKRLIGAGVGIGFLPTVVIDRSANRDSFWPMLPESLLPNYFVYLITHPESQQTQPTQLFLQEIRRRLSARGAPV